VKLVVLAGLPGTGKSAIARPLAERLGGPVLDKDGVRSALFAPGDVEYSREQDDVVMACIFRVAAFHAQRGKVPAVVLDGRTYSRTEQVTELRAEAAHMGAALVLIECVAAPEVARARLERDARAGAHPAANRGVELYERLRAEAQPIEGAHLVLATDARSPAELVEEVLAQLGA
jgi:adenylylsulfate kinase